MALEGDSVSAFGGVIGANREATRTPREASPAILTRRSSRRASRRRARDAAHERRSRDLACPTRRPRSSDDGIGRFDFKRIDGGLLVETFDSLEEDRDSSQLRVVTQRRPTLEELTDLLFAWRAVGT